MNYEIPFYLFSALGLVGGYLSFGAVCQVHPTVLRWLNRKEASALLLSSLFGLLVLILFGITSGYLVLVYLGCVPFGLIAAGVVESYKQK